MRIEALLAPAAPRLRLLTGRDELDRVVSGVMTTDLRDPGRYLRGGELVLTGMIWRSAPTDSERFVKVLVDGGAVALAAGEAEVGPVPADLIAACERHRMPLFAVPDDVAFATVTEYVVRQISSDRAADLSALVERHRMLVAAAGGGGLDAVLALLGGDLDLDCWVLTPTGRVVAGPAERLTERERSLLTRTFLAARSRGTRPPVRTAHGAGVRRFSLLPIPAEGGREGTPLAEWMLALTGDMTEWTDKRRELAENLARLAGTERARQEEGGRLRARLAGELVELLERDAPEAEVRRVLDAAQAMAGDGQAGTWFVVSAAGPGLSAAGLRTAMADAAGGLDPRALVAGTAAGVTALLPFETLASEGPAGAGGGAGDADGAPSAGGDAIGGSGTAAGRPWDGPSDADYSDAERARAGRLGAGPGADRTQAHRTEAERSGVGRAVAGRSGTGRPEAHRRIMADAPSAETGRPATGVSAAEAGFSAPAAAAARLRALLTPLEAGLGAHARLLVGVSTAVTETGALRGALEEARHARRIAAARDGRVSVAGPEELASHVLLLAAVPDDVRRAFRERLLGRVIAYDLEHQADLVATLEEFLRYDGSWTRCAAALHVHVNTLRYRVGRIEELTGRDLSRLADRVDFYLALELA